jgi:hypothetical protein
MLQSRRTRSASGLICNCRIDSVDTVFAGLQAGSNRRVSSINMVFMMSINGYGVNSGPLLTPHKRDARGTRDSGAQGA